MTDYKIVKAVHNGCEYDFGQQGDTYYKLNILAVGGGGGGICGGGGGGEVICGCYISGATSYSVTIGGGGATGANGGNTCITDGDATIIANGGSGALLVGIHGNWGGYSGNMHNGGGGCSYGCLTYGHKSGGGGGAGGDGNYWGSGGAGGSGLYGYGGGGGGAGAGQGTDGGGNGGTNGSNATNYGGGGGGGCVGGGGCGYQGMVEICYKTDGSCGFTSATGGQCCYTCNGYCVHRFTQDGTFTIA